MDTKLRRAAIFDGLDTAAANALARRCKKVKFSSGCTVFREGEPGDELYVVISGHVKITRCSAGGDEAVTAILGESDTFGELAGVRPRTSRCERDRAYRRKGGVAEQSRVARVDRRTSQRRRDLADAAGAAPAAKQ